MTLVIMVIWITGLTHEEKHLEQATISYLDPSSCAHQSNKDSEVMHTGEQKCIKGHISSNRVLSC